MPEIIARELLEVHSYQLHADSANFEIRDNKKEEIFTRQLCSLKKEEEK